MPGENGTGPQGMGALTGRGLGLCGGGMRRGLGRGFGRARCPARFAVGFTKEEEKKILEADLQDIESEKEAIQKRIKEIK